MNLGLDTTPKELDKTQRLQSIYALRKIKVHTSNEYLSGTSSTILLDLRVKEKSTDVVVNECKGLLLSGSGFERGEIGHFSSNDFGTVF